MVTNVKDDMNNINYKFDEPKYLEELAKYIDATYGQHYAQGRTKRQTLEGIIDAGHGIGFCVGNVMKYAERYGKKGDDVDKFRADMMKVLHYAVLGLYVHDKTYEE